MLFYYRVKNWLKSILKKPGKTLLRLPGKTKLISARLANRFLPFVSIENDRLYAPKATCASTLDWVSQFGKDKRADVRLVDVGYVAAHKPPASIYKKARQNLLMDENYLCPQTFVACIPNGRVLSEGLVVTTDDQLLDDVSVDFRGPPETKLANISRDWSMQRLTHIDGTVAVLSTCAANLYYHWLFQLLPRFELIRRAGIDLSTIDYFLVNRLGSPYQRESLEALAIENSKIIESCSAPYLRARKLIVPSVPLTGGCFPPWMCEFLRTTFMNKADRVTKSHRRIYIGRGSAGYRRILNEAKVIEFLGHFGFEAMIFETLTVGQQAAIMASCEAVVAPHGGGLSNLVFCSPGTKVVEIFSPELVAGYYWKLSSRLGLDYTYVLGTGAAATIDPDYPQSWDAHVDIKVDIGNLEKTLALAGII